MGRGADVVLVTAGQAGYAASFSLLGLLCWLAIRRHEITPETPA